MSGNPPTRSVHVQTKEYFMTRFSHTRRNLLAVLLLTAASLVATGCGSLDTTSGGDEPSHEGELKVLAGSELRDMEPLLDDIAKETGVKLYFEYSGTIDGAETIASGESDATMALFSNSKYIGLVTQNAGTPAPPSTSVMRSPVAFGVKKSIAKKFGWDDPSKFITWADLADKAASGELDYAMTNPTASNTGFSALLGVAAATAGDGNSLDASRVDNAVLKRFFAGQKLTAGGSGWLVDAYIERQGDLDGMINYESTLIELNQSGKLDEQLTLVYPTEGLLTADYPLMLLDKAHKPEYDKVVTYMKTPAFQAKIVSQTHRRPAVPGVKLTDDFPDNLLIELPFPPTLDVIQKLLFAYIDENSRPSHTYYVLDKSGSMDGDRMDALKGAMNNLTGMDKSSAGQFTRFRVNEQVTIIPFDDEVEKAINVTVKDAGKNGDELERIRTAVNGLQAEGGTAIYAALDEAYALAKKDQAQDPDRFYSIVLLSDGEQTDGIGYDEFEDRYKDKYAGQKIATFTVLFGDSPDGELRNVASLTDGKVFDGRQSLREIFKEIRGYQ